MPGNTGFSSLWHEWARGIYGFFFAFLDVFLDQGSANEVTLLFKLGNAQVLDALVE